MFKLNDKYEILTPKGSGDFNGVQKIIKSGRISFTTTQNDKPFVCAQKHKMKMYDGSWKCAKDLRIGEVLEHVNGSAVILSVMKEKGKFEFYDIIDSLNAEYISEGLTSHNCEFLGSSDTLISGKKLRELADYDKIAKDNWGLDIYKKPENGHNYIICADTSHGVGLDYSAFTVIDVTEVPYRLVAKFYDNQTSPMMYPEAIMHAALFYNDAWVLCENNDVGYEVVSSLYRDLEYENVITTVNKGRAGQKVSSGHGAGVQSIVFGLKMTPQVKRIGCANLKDLIECDKLIINDRETIEELSHFVKTPQSYEAEDGFHDDLCMSLVLFGWLCRQQYFRDLTNSDIRNKIVQEKYAEVWDDLLPAGFIDTGRDEVDAIDGTIFDPSWEGADYKL